jgi:Fe-S oxidoreductase
MCNNNGHCRKFDAGTMCPSFRVTRDEKHLTRGRANTLRLALSGQLGAHALTGDAVRDALDLCVGCKGCRRDCPTGVDMAKMKLEVLAQRRRVHGAGSLTDALTDALIARLPDYARFASAVPWLMNLRDRVPGLASLSEKLLGLSAKRSLPRWRRDTFARLAPSLGLAGRDAALTAAKSVVLFVDTFNGTFESENALAALRVLQAAGYTVHAAGANDAGGQGALCCGRTYLAAGRADEAKAKAKQLLDALLPFAQRGIAIVGLEPSCLLTLRDEMLAMGLGTDAALLSEHALLFEEFLAREARAGRFAPSLKPATRPMRVHGHCHQKAFGAIQPVLDVLRLIPGADVALIESSCCGMAGSFGYEASHHTISMQMAELSLLPAVRAAPDALIVADGTSCRHQIADGAGREALHVARVLADHLVQGERV